MDASKAIDVLRNLSNYHIGYSPFPVIRLSETTGKEISDIVEHQQAEIERLTKDNQAFIGAGLRYEEEIARKDASIQRLLNTIDGQSQVLKKYADADKHLANDLPSGMYTGRVRRGRNGDDGDTP